MNGEKKDNGFARGVKAAAGVASMYDHLSLHDHLVSDCILLKLNVDKRKKPRKNRFPHLLDETSWMIGFALALAEINRKWDQPSRVEEVMREAGVTIARLKAAGVEYYDLKELKRCLRPVSWSGLEKQKGKKR